MFSPILPILPLQSPSTRGTTKRLKSQAQLSLQHLSQTQSPSIYATCPNEQESITTEGAASGGSTGGDQRHWRLKRKRQRQNHARHCQQFTRAQFPGGRFPAKFGCQPIKLELNLVVHTYPANYVRVQLRHLGVYKESRVATKPFGLGLAKV